MLRKEGETMAIKAMFRNTVRGGVVVSTVRLEPGLYETAFIVNGRVSDGVRSTDKGAASVVHDLACDYINLPSQRAPHSRFDHLFAEVA